MAMARLAAVALHCPWMAMNGLVAIKEVPTDGAERHEILRDEDSGKGLDPA